MSPASRPPRSISATSRASGGEPDGLIVTLGVPGGAKVEDVVELYEG